MSPKARCPSKEKRRRGGKVKGEKGRKGAISKNKTKYLHASLELKRGGVWALGQGNTKKRKLSQIEISVLKVSFWGVGKREGELGTRTSGCGAKIKRPSEKKGRRWRMQ